MTPRWSGVTIEKVRLGIAITTALISGLIGFIPFFAVQFAGQAPSMIGWSASQFLGTGLMLALFFGAAIWIGYALPQVWWTAALVAWTTVLQAVTNIQRQNIIPPAGVEVKRVDLFTLLFILIVPLGVAIAGGFVGRTRRL